MSEALLTIPSAENAVELTLPQTSVSMRLAQATLDEVRDELHAEPDRDAPGLTGRFVRFVTDSVEKLVKFLLQLRGVGHKQCKAPLWVHCRDGLNSLVQTYGQQKT